MEYISGMKVRLAETGRRYPIGTVLTIISVSPDNVAVRIQYKNEDPWWFHLPVALVPLTKITKTKELK